jgi:hypothetical protein
MQNEHGSPPVTRYAGAGIVYGSIGGILLSVAGFLPWALAGRFLTKAMGEAGFYAVCAVVFLGASGPLLHHLLKGEKTLVRFYRLFVASFVPYAIGWTAGWMALRGHAGSLAGLILGCLAMALVLCAWFGRWRAVVVVTGLLLVAQVPGYFVGGWAYAWLGGLAKGVPWLAVVAKLSWGVFYGWGLGAGLALALGRLQAKEPRVAAAAV